MLTWNLTLCDYCHESTRLEHGSSTTVAAGRLKELEPGKGRGVGGAGGDTQGVQWLGDLGPGWHLKRPDLENEASK